VIKIKLIYFISDGILFFIIGYLWRKFIGERTIKSAEKKAKEIIEEAENFALNKKKELDIEIKEKIYRLRSEFEKETRNKKREIQFQEKRLQQKEFNLERRAELLEKKESEFSAREQVISKKEIELKEKENYYSSLIEVEKRKLEKISGITSEEAKNQLLKIMEEEAKKEAIKIQLKLEEQARENAEKYFSGESSK